MRLFVGHSERPAHISKQKVKCSRAWSSHRGVAREPIGSVRCRWGLSRGGTCLGFVLTPALGPSPCGVTHFIFNSFPTFCLSPVPPSNEGISCRRAGASPVLPAAQPDSGAHSADSGRVHERVSERRCLRSRRILPELRQEALSPSSSPRRDIPGVASWFRNAPRSENTGERASGCGPRQSPKRPGGNGSRTRGRQVLTL